MNKEDTIKTNAWFLVFTLFLCYSIFFWPKVMTDRGDVYFFSTASFSITTFFFAFLSPYFIYFNYNFLMRHVNKDLSRRVSIFILVLAILAPVYPGFVYYSDLDTLKTQHSENYCGAELQIGRSMPLLERFSFNKQCEK